MSSLSITAVGIIIVFVILVLITYIVKLYSWVLSSKKSDENVLPKPDFNVVHNIMTTNNYCDTKTEPKNNDNPENVSDEEIIAVITAAIQASYAGREVNTRIRVRSFRRVSTDIPAWRYAACKNQIPR